MSQQDLAISGLLIPRDQRGSSCICATRLDADRPPPPHRKLGSFTSLRMTTSAQDTHWMHRALELARRGIGLASPNPAVGCVIVHKAGELISEGWHEYDLLDHAEIAALKNAAGITSDAGCPIHSAAFAEWVGSRAADRLKGATAYVTLEPCNHTGRTGPCTQALIA